MKHKQTHRCRDQICGCQGGGGGGRGMDWEFGVNRSKLLYTEWINYKVLPPMVFPVVMYGCENWILKKAEGQMLLNYGV